MYILHAAGNEKTMIFKHHLFPNPMIGSTSFLNITLTIFAT
jgi:ABC-type microcin C transport system permease subunit YejE